MPDPKSLALPQHGALTQFSIADAVGRIRLDDGSEVRVGLSALGKIPPIVGTRLRVIEAAPYPLGGFKASRVDAVESVDAKAKEEFELASIRAQFTADPEAAVHLLGKLRPELLTARERAALDAYRADQRAQSEAIGKRMEENARKKRTLELERARADAASPESAWRDRLKKAHLSADATEHIVGSLLPAARLVPTLGHPDPLGTRFGGAPVLAANTRWPEYQGKPLAFLAQVRVRELSAAVRGALHLPADGLLAFFFEVIEEPWGFDPKHAGAGQVLWVPEPPATETNPPELPANCEHFEPTAVSIFGTAVPPGLESVYFDEKWLSEEESEAVGEIRSEWEFADDVPHHRIGGHPGEVQGGMELECALLREGVYTGRKVDTSTVEYARAKVQAPRWKLLAQFDTDDDLRWMWGDSGRLYFWMHEDDLKQQRFERAWCLLQCY